MLIISTRPVAAIIHAVSAGSILDAGAWASAAVEPARHVAAVSTEAIVARRALPVMVSSPCCPTDRYGHALPAVLIGRPRRVRTCRVKERRAIGLIGEATGFAASPRAPRLGVLLQLLELRLEEQLCDQGPHQDRKR